MAARRSNDDRSRSTRRTGTGTSKGKAGGKGKGSGARSAGSSARKAAAGRDVAIAKNRAAREREVKAARRAGGARRHPADVAEPATEMLEARGLGPAADENPMLGVTPPMEVADRAAMERADDVADHELPPSADGPFGLVTMVCLTCGNEMYFDRTVPSSLKCDRCGNTVFRSFATPTEPDEAAISELEEQARSQSFGDSSPATAPDELRDLDNP